MFLLVLNLYLNQVIKIKEQTLRIFTIRLIAGMLFLARTDSFFIIALMMLYFNNYDNGKQKRKFCICHIMGNCLNNCCIPWLIFTISKYGNLIQDSASSASIILLRELLIGYEAEFSTYIRLVMLDIGRYIKFIIPDYFGYPHIL